MVVVGKNSMESQPKLSTLASLSRKELIIIFSLCVTLLISIAYKYTVDYHLNTPDIEVIQPQSGLGIQRQQQIRFQLDINKADWHELILLPKVGEVRAKAIVAHRKKYGEFQDISQLRKVKGVNVSVVEAIKNYVLVRNSP